MKPLVVTLLATVVAAGCGGGGEPKAVPNVTGLALDAAEARLEARGLDAAVAGGGTFGVILRSRWQVCDQEPHPGQKAVEVTLVIERACSTIAPRHATVVPDVEYESLDDAELELAQAGLGYEVDADGVIIVRSNWTVCTQKPGPGDWGDVVELYVERGDCWDW